MKTLCLDIFTFLASICPTFLAIDIFQALLVAVAPLIIFSALSFQYAMVPSTFNCQSGGLLGNGSVRREKDFLTSTMTSSMVPTLFLIVYLRYGFFRSSLDDLMSSCSDSMLFSSS
jgi:hypothetical protein